MFEAANLLILLEYLTSYLQRYFHLYFISVCKICVEKIGWILPVV